ncbi:MAG: hypothetical protein HYX53_00015 [Chloroflexi bacterium]|nr:hypothetical protein [Chloroflexota bacterium]
MATSQTEQDTRQDGRPSIGDRVVAADGQDCGAVKEVRGGYFAVDAPMARDYWLSEAYVTSRSAGRVVLSLPKDEVAQHGLEAPGLEPTSDPDRAGPGDAVISDAEALATRERMERELAEQRRRMAANR